MTTMPVNTTTHMGMWRHSWLPLQIPETRRNRNNQQITTKGRNLKPKLQKKKKRKRKKKKKKKRKETNMETRRKKTKRRPERRYVLK